MESLTISPRDDDDVEYYNPAAQIYVGLWTLFVGASVFLALRLWCKLTRRHGLWYDDYVLLAAYVSKVENLPIASSLCRFEPDREVSQLPSVPADPGRLRATCLQLFLMATDVLITVEYATGYSRGHWDDRMHILINTSSIGTVIGQAVSKTAFGVTLLRMVEARWQAGILWFCIVSMDGIAFSKCIFQWAKLCGRDDYQQWYRIQGWCLDYGFSQQWKEVGNIYNIIMDFIFALFPWFITWKLNLKRAEKIALCVTLSLGIVVAVITAIRTWWKDTPLMHVHDRWYIWRDAMSQIWYSAEVAGTIIVQCIPVLRPFVKDLHTSLTSRRLGATDRSKASTWRDSALLDRKAPPGYALDSKSAPRGGADEESQKAAHELAGLPPPRLGYHADAYYSPSEVDLRIKQSHTKPVPPPPAPPRRDNAGGSWPL